MKKRYSKKDASAYWNRRVADKPSLEAVLTYSAPPALNNYYDKWEKDSLLVQLPESLHKKTVLDIGAGIGRISRELAKKSARVIAVDIAEEMLWRLKQYAIRNKVTNITTVQLASDQLNKLEQKFDYIICFGLLEHLPPTLRRRTIIQAMELLKKNGKIFVVINNPSCPYLRGRYQKNKRNKKGHFVTTVGFPWLKEICEEHNMRSKITAANPFYALLHYQLYLENPNMFSDNLLKHFSRRFLREDLAVDIKDRELITRASHFLVKIQHR